MEFLPCKRNRVRKCKRKRNSYNRRRRAIKAEIRTSPKHRKDTSECANILLSREEIINTMEAGAFWENYTAAYEWQRRHHIAWWRSRCFALEHENKILRDKLRSYIRSENSQNFLRTTNEREKAVKEEKEGCNETGEENLEFQVNDDMMSFLEQSIRHKMELKQKRESQLAAEMEKDKEQQQVNIDGGAAWVKARNEGAKLLYGDASSRILAMETALQATTDRHKDRAKPQYWPNIPLNLHVNK